MTRLAEIWLATDPLLKNLQPRILTYSSLRDRACVSPVPSILGHFPPKVLRSTSRHVSSFSDGSPKKNAPGTSTDGAGISKEKMRRAGPFNGGHDSCSHSRIVAGGKKLLLPPSQYLNKPAFRIATFIAYFLFPVVSYIKSS